MIAVADVDAEDAKKAKAREYSRAARERERQRPDWPEILAARAAKAKAKREANREHYLAVRRDYSEREKERIRKLRRESHARHREKNCERMRQKYVENKESRNATSRADYVAKREYYRSINRQYYKENKRRISAQKREYSKERRASDPMFAEAGRLRARLIQAFRRAGLTKKDRTFELIGCTPLELRDHIESLFLDGMSFENRSEWHIDHVFPMAAANLFDRSHVLAVCNWRNLRPIWVSENLAKCDTVTPEAQSLFDGLVETFKDKN